MELSRTSFALGFSQYSHQSRGDGKDSEHGKVLLAIRNFILLAAASRHVSANEYSLLH
jgi:hypothetical protein